MISCRHRSEPDHVACLVFFADHGLDLWSCVLGNAQESGLDIRQGRSLVH
jgi:hypothetical protein